MYNKVLNIFSHPLGGRGSLPTPLAGSRERSYYPQKDAPLYGRGFAATISVILLATGILAFSIITAASAMTYSDATYRRELRIQVRMNLSACLETVRLMIARDYYIAGTKTITEFGCTVNIDNDNSGSTSARAVAELAGIREFGSI